MLYFNLESDNCSTIQTPGNVVIPICLLSFQKQKEKAKNNTIVLLLKIAPRHDLIKPN